MKFLCLGFLLLSLACAVAREVEMDHGNITFEAPEDFTPLNEAEMAVKFPFRNGPIEAVGNDTRAVSISYKLTRNAVRPEQLSELKDALTVEMGKLAPDLQWIKNDFIEINGTKWIYLENTTQGLDQRIHNIEIATSYRGVMVVINFNSTTKLFDSYQEKLQASLHSVKIRDNSSAFPPLNDSMPSPGSADEQVQHGQAAVRESDMAGAEKAFQAALRLNPKLASAALGLGNVALDKGLSSDAVKYYSEALADDPNFAEAFARRATVEADNCDLDVASADVQKAIDLKPSPLAYRVRGLIEERRGDLDLALADYDQALKLRADYTPALNGRGWLHLIEGDLAQARDDFQSASLSSRNDYVNCYNLAILSLLEGRQNSALTELNSVTELAHGRPMEHAQLFRWVIEAREGHQADADQELSSYLNDSSQLKRDWAKNIGAFLVGQISEGDLIASADADNPMKSKLQHCRVWYFIGLKHQIAGENSQAVGAWQKCVATEQRYSEDYLLARAQLPKPYWIQAGLWISSQFGPLLNLGNKSGITPLVILLVGSIFLTFIILGVVIVMLIVNHRPTKVPSSRPINRAPPMR